MLFFPGVVPEQESQNPKEQSLSELTSARQHLSSAQPFSTPSHG